VKKALISGASGQDGSYLAELLLEKGYEVHGIIRRSSLINTARIDHIYDSINLHYGDLTDSTNLISIIQKVQPDEIYNLGAQSHVKVSFETPEYTGQVDALGTLRILEAVRLLGMEKKTKIYQASTSELYGLVPGILFNHESPRRGETFVTRKITRGLSRISTGKQDILYLGNLNSKRDWGHAADFVRAMWMMLQQNEPDDYVIATGEQYSVREFVEKSAPYFGMKIAWMGEGLEEVGYDTISGNQVIAVNPKYFRPAEVETLLGDATKAKQKLGWEPKISFDELVEDMCKNEL